MYNILSIDRANVFVMPCLFICKGCFYYLPINNVLVGC